MPLDDRTRALLWDMRKYAETVLRPVHGSSFDEYRENEVQRLAVERALQIIGEAASQVPVSFWAEHPEIEWQRIVGLWHILVHDYTRIDQEILWEIAVSSAPELLELLKPLVGEAGKD
jgi:uncharacterized protein with HEPN domain